jgi:C4-dicarboxylate-specific signal transduction histidine kinase
MMKEPTEKTELDINEVIKEVLDLAGPALVKNRILLELQLTDRLPLVVGDRVQLQQVFLNLIANGIEAMSSVDSRRRRLCVESRMEESETVTVVIRDSGIGLGPEVDRVFAPFFTTKTNGMGMGLSISRSLVEGLGGRLWASSDFLRGAEFCFTVPTAVPRFA